MIPHPKTNPPNLTRCPHCGNKTLHETRHREDYSEAFDETEDGLPIMDSRWWAILKCTTCGKLSLYQDYWDEEVQRWKGELAYPLPYRAPKEVPVKIRKVFDEAISVLHGAPNFAAVGIRRCLEAIVDDQQAKGKTLAERIRFLSKSGNLPDTLVDMMDTSRFIGNLGAHFSNKNVTKEDVLILIEFTQAIFEYIYVAPARIDSLRKSLANR